MKALFITTNTNDVYSLIRAWEYWNTAADWVTFDIGNRVKPDGDILDSIVDSDPDVIFYIGAATERGTPTVELFKKLRDRAPTIHICCDSGDQPWHPLIDRYRANSCFNLQVGIDGVHSAPVDLVTTTPIDPRPFPESPTRKLRPCGFSGGIGNKGPRHDIVRGLENDGAVTVRKRDTVGGYAEHVRFMSESRVVLNTSWSGTGAVHQVKGRVIEASLAWSAALEHVQSPAHNIFPSSALYPYENKKEAFHIIRDLDPIDAADRANIAHDFVTWNCLGEIVYKQILEGIVDVDSTNERASA